MAHDVTFTLPERSLGNADAEFNVRRDGRAFGRLKIAKGSLVWVQANDQYGYKMNWQAFDELMKTHGDPERKR